MPIKKIISVLLLLFLFAAIFSAVYPSVSALPSTLPFQGLIVFGIFAVFVYAIFKVKTD